MAKLPETVYVQWYQDEGTPGKDGQWLTVSESEAGAVDADCGAFTPGKRVGIYKLVEVATLTELPRKITKKRIKN